MLDITNYVSSLNTYGGSETKRTYYIDGKKYMVKFPDPVRKLKANISYVNNQYSEFIGCKIFELFGIDVQKVNLVKCNVDGKDKVAVMCEDFLTEDEMLIEFKTLSYSLSTEKIYTNDINDIFEMVSIITSMKDRKDFKSKFWDIFIVDTLIGNVDRHLGNWAIIASNDTSRLSPVYDCGSALHPLLSEEDVLNVIKNKEIKNISINLKTAYKLNDKTLNYIDVYELMPSELASSLKKMYPLIDLEKIKNIIFSIDVLSDTMKEFYYNTIKIRKTEILDKYYNKIID